MKPSNKERREVAVMLRCDVPTECNMTDGELLDEITDIIMPRGSSYSSVEEHDAAFVNRLADLIEPEERTCNMRNASWDDGQSTWGCICSKCGARHEHTRGRWLNFCPDCGARVVEDHA